MSSLIAHGVLAGSPNVKAIRKRSAALSQGQRKAIGLNMHSKERRLVIPTGQEPRPDKERLARGHSF